MPTPPNITPDLAIEITAFPYAQVIPVVDLTDVPASDYPPECAGTQFKALWWKYTAQVGDVAIGVSADVAGPDFDYVPNVSMWVGPASALTVYAIFDGNQNFCGPTGGGFGYPFTVPVTPGVTYYLQVSAYIDNGPPYTSTMTVRVIGQPNRAIPAGAILIPDDSPRGTGNEFPGVVFSAADGRFLRFVLMPSGEFGDTMPTGELCVQDGEDNGAVRVLGNQLQSLGTLDLSGRTLVGIKSDYHNVFYILSQPMPIGGITNVQTISRTGAVGATTWVLPANSANSKAFAVTQDGATLYYGDWDLGVTPGVIHAYSLAASSALPDLHARFPSEIPRFTGDGFVASDGTIWFGYQQETGAAVSKLRQFNPAGTVLKTYNLVSGDFTFFNRYQPDPDNSTIWCWSFNSNAIGGAGSLFRRVLKATGATVTEFPMPTTSDSGSGTPGTDSTHPFAISNSCPILVLQGPLLPTPAAVVGGMGIDCTSNIVTITGANFAPGAAIDLRDPTGQPVDFTIVSFSPTLIELAITYTRNGQYCVTVTNP